MKQALCLARFKLSPYHHQFLQENAFFFFLVKDRTSDFLELHVFILHYDISSVGTFKCIEYSELLDYYPLGAYKSGMSLLITLKHAIST